LHTIEHAAVKIDKVRGTHNLQWCYQNVCKNLHRAVYTISHVYFGGEEGGGEGGTKFSRNIAESFAKSFAKILAKFYDLKISSNRNTNNNGALCMFTQCFENVLRGSVTKNAIDTHYWVI